MLLKWTIVFLLLALIAGILGFGGVAAGAATIGQILFFVFVGLFILTLVGDAVKA